MRSEVVTSFSASGADLYGRRCVESWRRFGGVPMTVYADSPLILEGVQIRQTSEIPGWSETRSVLPQRREDATRPSIYRWNARRFAVKTFVWCDAAERLGSGILTWLDGDTETVAPVPQGFFVTLLGNAHVAFLGRKPVHPETGYVGFRIPQALPLLRWCREAFVNGTFRSWDGWTDCHALRAGLCALGVTSRDLTSHLYTGDTHIWKRSPLGPYMRHYKGNKSEALSC